MTPDRIIADFITASAHMETYLVHRGPLNAVQQDAVANTIQGLQTFLDIWKIRMDDSRRPRKSLRRARSLQKEAIARQPTTKSRASERV